MKTENAMSFKEFLVKANNVFWTFYSSQQHDEYVDINEIKDEVKESFFETFHNSFIEELKENIKEYQDIHIVSHYVRGCFMELEEWGYDSDLNVIIINQGNEVTFLIKLKKAIETYANEIQSFMVYDRDGNPEGLFSIYYETIKDLDSSKEEKKEEYKPYFDIRFDYENMKAECDELKTTKDKIIFIHDRLNYLKQWQLQYDIDEGGIIDGIFYKFSPQYYPNFEKLCKIELERLEKNIVLEQKMSLSVPKMQDVDSQTKKNIQSSYIWDSSDTNLLELVAALHKENIIKRKDKKDLTRKELIEYFSQLFDLQIKDVEGKLTRATGRNDNTPFLDSLRIAFKNYGMEKEEKQRKRK